MRTALITLSFLSLMALGLISYNSLFEVAPVGFRPDLRQVLLLTPVGMTQNFITRPDPVWTQVYSLHARRAVNIFDGNILLPYLLLLGSSFSALWFLKRL